MVASRRRAKLRKGSRSGIWLPGTRPIDDDLWEESSSGRGLGATALSESRDDQSLPTFPGGPEDSRRRLELAQDPLRQRPLGPWDERILGQAP